MIGYDDYDDDCLWWLWRWLVMMTMTMIGYDDYDDDWLWWLWRWLVMSTVMMIGYDDYDDDWLWWLRRWLVMSTMMTAVAILVSGNYLVENYQLIEKIRRRWPGFLRGSERRGPSEVPLRRWLPPGDSEDQRESRSRQEFRHKCIGVPLEET